MANGEGVGVGPLGARINTLYSVTGARGQGTSLTLRAYYARGISPSLILFPFLTDIKIEAQDLYENGAIETRDLTPCFYRFQRRIRALLLLKRVRRRMAGRTRLLLDRELGRERWEWGEAAVAHHLRREIDRGGIL